MRTITFAICLLLCLCAFCRSVSAGTQSFDTAVKIYLSGDYEKALPLFQSLSKAEPQNAKFLYYLALCHQGLDKDDKSAEEYERAIELCKDPAFKEILRARKAKIDIRRGAHAQSAPLPDEPEPKVKRKGPPVKKVICFYTNWCPTCRRFESSWKIVELQFKGRVAFERLNAEDPKNWALVEKYKPKAYPTLVYLDAGNNVIESVAKAPTAEKFVKHLLYLQGK